MRQLGTNGPAVFPLGLGCMAMSDLYGPADRSESIATIQMAIERGVNLIDTGDFYGMGHNEMLIAEAIEGRREKVLLSVKFGALRGPDGAWFGFDSRPAAVKNSLAYSLRRLKTDYVDIYRPARLDPQVPIEDTIGAIADMVKAGYVRYIGLSEVGAATIRRAHAVHPICDLQIEYSIVTRGAEAKIVPVLNELGIGMTAYGVMSRGLLSGSPVAAKGDIRGHMPRFIGTNKAKNEALAGKLATLAAEWDVTVAQLAFAWVLAKGGSIVPLVGSRKRAQLLDSLGALGLEFTAEELAMLETAIPPDAVSGTRYPMAQMRSLDSEV